MRCWSHRRQVLRRRGMQSEGLLAWLGLEHVAIVHLNQWRQRKKRPFPNWSFLPLRHSSQNSFNMIGFFCSDRFLWEILCLLPRARIVFWRKSITSAAGGTSFDTAIKILSWIESDTSLTSVGPLDYWLLDLRSFNSVAIFLFSSNFSGSRERKGKWGIFRLNG